MPPSDEGGDHISLLIWPEGEITRRYNNTPIFDSSRIICIIFYNIESSA